MQKNFGNSTKENQLCLVKLSNIPSLWRNRLARSAVNRKVGGSSPPRDERILFFITLFCAKIETG